ncbi:MAG: hypothetical protein AAGG50_15375 [Bacteroidota bacterium]
MRFSLRPLACALFLALISPAPMAQEVSGPVYAHALPDVPRSSARSGAPVTVTSRGASAEFIVIYDGFPSEAQAAFQAAVDLWADYIVSSVPIRVDAVWEGLDSENTLGAAGPFIVRYEEDDARPPGIDFDVWYPISLVNARAGRDVDTSTMDITATFNADFERWHFGLGAPGPNEFDLKTVVLHELAHGLGFIGALTADGGTGTLLVTGGQELPFPFDLLARDCEGNAALDESRYPRPSDALETLLTGRALYIGGPTIEAAAAGDTPVPLFAPTSWTTGSSYSHLDEATFPNTNAQSLMTPFFTGGERILSPGALTCAVLRDIGWDLGPGCTAIVQDESPVVVDIGGDACAGTNPPDPNPPPTTPPAPEIFTLDALSPTVLVPSQGTSTIRFTVTFGTDTNLDVFLYDTLGQLHLTRRFAGAAETEVVDVPIELGGLDLASGAYFVAFQSGGRQRVERITVVR